MVVGNFETEVETVVIGSGPGGYVAAIRAAQLGQKVILIEKENIGGVCLNVGCIPSKALIHIAHQYQASKEAEIFGIINRETTIDFQRAQEWKNHSVVNKLTSGVEMLLKKNKVEIVRGEAHFIDENKVTVMVEAGLGPTFSFKNAIIATGSRPIEIKGFPFGGRIIDSTGALNLEEIPKTLTVIGGGYIGTELATAFANLGSSVTIIEGTDRILSNFEGDMTKFVEKNLEKKGVKIYSHAFAKEAKQNEDKVSVSFEADGEIKEVTSDYCLVTVGRRPNTDELGLEVTGIELDNRGLIKVDGQCRTNNPAIYAIGDITNGLALAHKASYEGKVAAEALAGSKEAAIDYFAIPSVCFSDPEIASVGYTLEEAQKEGYQVKAYKFPLNGNGRALSLNAAEGFVRLIINIEDYTLLGAQIVGVNASDILAELGLAIENSISVHDIALTIHSHPSLGESIMDTAELALGKPIHI